MSSKQTPQHSFSWKWAIIGVICGALWALFAHQIIDNPPLRYIFEIAGIIVIVTALRTLHRRQH